MTNIDVCVILNLMKLSKWARKMGISYRRAWQMFKDGKLPNARQLPTGTIVVLEGEEEKAVIYSFSAKLYGLRRAKRKTEKIIKEITQESQDD